MRPSWVGAGVLVAAGFGIYLALNWAVYGDPMAFSDIQRNHWFKQLAWPWEGIASVTGWFGDPNINSAILYGWAELVAIVIGGIATLVTIVLWRPTWSAWMAGNWLLIVSTGFVLSVPRYALALFGIVVGAAVVADRWRTAGVVLAVASAAAMAFFTWRFAVGLWAF
jgi:hypothetical protein